jgi:molecular chaperone DnaK
VHVLQGEREMAADNKSLATFQLLGIPPAPRGIPQIQVTFDIDANGLVAVSAKDLGTGKEQTVRVVATSGLNEAEIERMIAEAETQKGADAQRREVAELKLTVEALLYTTERAVAEYGHVLSAMDRDALLAEVAAAKQALGADAADLLRQTQARLEIAAQKIGEAVYASASGGETEET